MRKTYWILALIALFWIGDRTGGYVLDLITQKSGFRYSRLYTNRAACDILLVGNSRGLSFYQPYLEEISDKKTFNLSYNGLPVDLAAALIEDYFERYPPPKRMLLDITLGDRFNPELIANFNFYRTYTPRLDSLIFAIDQKSAYAGVLSHLFRYNSEVFQRTLYYLKHNDEDWLLDRTITRELIQKVENEAYEFIIKYPSQAPALINELVEMVESKGTEVVMVINPYYPLFRGRMTNLDEFKKKVEEATGRKVHDYSTAIKGEEHFGDLQHLNKKGSLEYVQLLEKAGYLK